MYKKITNEDVLVLQKIVGKESIKVASDIEKDLAHDELGTVFSYPEVYVAVTDKFQVQEIMKYAFKETIPVTVRGSGTGLVGACVAIHGGILLDTTKMNKFIEFDKINMTLTLEPGVLLMEIYDM